jgi:hypothetical protein
VPGEVIVNLEVVTIEATAEDEAVRILLTFFFFAGRARP